LYSFPGSRFVWQKKKLKKELISEPNLPLGYSSKLLLLEYFSKLLQQTINAFFELANLKFKSKRFLPCATGPTAAFKVQIFLKIINRKWGLLGFLLPYSVSNDSLEP